MSMIYNQTLGTPTGTLVLSDKKPFARGGTRECYVHPGHPDLCVKVAREGRSPEIRHRKSGWWTRCYKSIDDFDDSVRDYQTLSSIQSRNSPSLWDHLPQCIGWAETDLGRGLVVELIRDADGLISRSFVEYLWTYGFDEPAQAAVDEFADFWEVSAIPTRSLFLDNLIAQRLPDGRIRLVVIDGFGSTVLIPWYTWNRAFAKIWSRRKTQALRRDIEMALARKSRGESPSQQGFLLSLTCAMAISGMLEI